MKKIILLLSFIVTCFSVVAQFDNSYAKEGTLKEIANAVGNTPNDSLAKNSTLLSVLAAINNLSTVSPLTIRDSVLNINATTQILNFNTSRKYLNIVYTDAVNVCYLNFKNDATTSDYKLISNIPFILTRNEIDTSRVNVLCDPGAVLVSFMEGQ